MLRLNLLGCVVASNSFCHFCPLSALTKILFKHLKAFRFLWLCFSKLPARTSQFAHFWQHTRYYLYKKIKKKLSGLRLHEIQLSVYLLILEILQRHRTRWAIRGATSTAYTAITRLRYPFHTAYYRSHTESNHWHWLVCQL